MAILDLFKDIASYPKALRDLRGDRRTGTDKDSADLRGRQGAFVEALHPRRMQLRVAGIVDETRSTRTLRMERTDGPLPPFRPGQYVNLFVEIDGVPRAGPTASRRRPAPPPWTSQCARSRTASSLHTSCARSHRGHASRAPAPSATSSTSR